MKEQIKQHLRGLDILLRPGSVIANINRKFESGELERKSSDYLAASIFELRRIGTYCMLTSTLAYQTGFMFS